MARSEKPLSNGRGANATRPNGDRGNGRSAGVGGRADGVKNGGPDESAAGAGRGLEWAALGIVLAAWAVLVVAPNRTAPHVDLVPVAVGAKISEYGDYSSLYEHDPVFFNLASNPSFLGAVAALGCRAEPTPFVYPPLVAVLARPLTIRPFPEVAQVWLLIATAATVAGVVFGARYFAPSFRRPAAWAALVIALSLFEPIRYGLWLDQTTPVTFLLTMLALWLAERDRPLAAGAALAFAAFVKLTPALFALVWIWQRRWKPLIFAGASLAVLVLLSVAICGLGPNLDYLRRLREIGHVTVVAYNNHSLPALFTRLAQPADEVHRWRMFVPPIGAGVAVWAAGIALLLACWQLPRALEPGLRSRVRAALIALFTLLVPGFSWTHYFILLVPLGLLVWEMADRVPGTWAYRVSLLVPLLLCSRPVLPAQDFPRRHPGPILAGPTFAAILVALLILWLTRSIATGGRRTQPS
jgi:alpha-1,2-mannosyltransferase